MRILLWLEKPAREIVVVVDEPEPRFGKAHGRPVFGGRELDYVLSLNPSAEEFNVICAAKMATDGRVSFLGADDPYTAAVDGYGEEDELVT
jgi:hypothetical protein